MAHRPDSRDRIAEVGISQDLADDSVVVRRRPELADIAADSRLVSCLTERDSLRIGSYAQFGVLGAHCSLRGAGNGARSSRTADGSLAAHL
jgi:hypothetical protein